MDPITILVMILSAGVIALLAWFEINSRRNDARTKSPIALSQSGFETGIKRDQIENEPNVHRKKAA